MSATQTLIGTGILATALQAVWLVVGPGEVPIKVNALTYDGGFITQDRTVNTDAKFTAEWAAEIVDARTGVAVVGCTGSGVWDYEPGRKAVTMTIQEWVGSPTCDLAPGSYFPRATYKGGTFYTVERGPIFEVDG